jgi:hypothetical protein
MIKIMLLISISISCSSAMKKNNSENVHPEFKPYVLNYLQNHNSDITPEFNNGDEMKIVFDETLYAPTHAAYCKMNKDIEKRVVYVNKEMWKKSKDRDAYFMAIIHTCGAYKPESYYGDIYLRFAQHYY